MSKASSSTLHEIQTRPLPQDHDQTDQEQSPPLITDGLKSKVDQKGAGDHDGVQRKNHNMCIVDVRNGEESESISTRERVCRICQLSSDHLCAGAGIVNIVQLGCACKGELGTSHYHCAKAWFMQRGNRTCEICGKPAKNIEGIEDVDGAQISVISTSTEIDITSTNSTEMNNRYAKSLCNFILAALILAFLLPWVFHPGKLF